MFEDDYYLVLSSDVQKYPLIYEDCDRLSCPQQKSTECEKIPDCPAYFYYQEGEVENPERHILDFIPAVGQKEIIYADVYMALQPADGTFVISNNLHTILSGMDIHGVQFFPVTLMENNTEKYTDFWYVHIYNLLAVLDSRKSTFQILNGVKKCNNLLKIKLDAEKMMKIDLSDRLVFKLLGKKGYFLFHKSIVEKILTTNPIGVQFIKISEYEQKN
jgi:hypothetical protein